MDSLFLRYKVHAEGRGPNLGFFFFFCNLSAMFKLLQPTVQRNKFIFFGTLSFQIELSKGSFNLLLIFVWYWKVDLLENTPFESMLHPILSIPFPKGKESIFLISWVQA